MDQGILELVKNAYDANATECVVTLEETDEPGGKISVVDTGDGMTVDEIKNGWLVLGKSKKSTSERTRLGRIPAGNKGLGRLASLRLGRSVTLSTRPRHDQLRRHELVVDWRRFDAAEHVGKVPLKVRTFKSKKARRSGTSVEINDLHERIGKAEVKRLARALILLGDPFRDKSSFKPTLVAPEYADLEGLVQRSYFADAEYHLIASLDSQGIASSKVVDFRGKTLYAGTHAEIAANRKSRGYACPAASFEVWIFLLDGQTFATRSTNVGQVREWLNEVGGVHVFHNELRVSPYGNEGDDWLGLNLRRAQNPESRPSTNTLIGRVDVVDQSGALVQKTDRSGFIENEPFYELHAFCHDVMEWIAGRRLEDAEKKRAKARAEAPTKSSSAKQKVEAAISNAPQGAREQFEEAFSGYEKQRDREVGQLQREVQLYRTLSTAGITAATFAHESAGNPIKVISQSVSAIERRSRANFLENYKEYLEDPVLRIRRAVGSLSVLGVATLRLIDHEKRRRSKVDLNGVLRNVLKTFKPFADGRDVVVRASYCAGEPYLHGSEAAVESIITNLVNNALGALEDSDQEERVLGLATSIVDGNWLLSVMDNGPGIEGIRLREIWLPGRTTRKNGTGLGLTIVRDAALDLGGTVSAKASGPLGGAEIIVSLPIIE